MSDGKNALKLSEDYIYFNLNLKIILSRLINYQKIIYTVPETFDIWSHLLGPTFPSGTILRETRE